ncbi:hypothetical protein ACWGID_15510 [Kribbella sp. NPDC054772]
MEQMMVALTAGQSPALGNIWRITTKETDFYLDPLGDAGAVHLSVHGPNDLFEEHRFHIKIDRRAVAASEDQFVAHSIPRKGFAFDGQQVAADAFRVARIRWTWHLQRPRFRSAAISGPAPDLAEHQSGRRLSTILKPNSAWDIDLVVSYGNPYWPANLGEPSTGDPRLGPLRNGAGHWLTATSHHRSQAVVPAPDQLGPRLPSPDEQPNRILCGGPGPAGAADMYWWVETITSRELIQASRDMAQ